MLVNRQNLSMHGRWIVFCTLATIASVSWYWFACQQAETLLGGSSLPGLVFGVAGALIIAFEMLLWPRKKLRAWRVGPTQVWLRAHIWLGLLAVPLILMHTGFRMGGQLTTILMVLFAIVILSGVFGLAMQNILPRMLLENIPAETIYSQIDDVAAHFARDAARRIDLLCPQNRKESVDEEFTGARNSAEDGPGHIVIGAVRSSGSIRGRVLKTETVPLEIRHAQVLREAFEQTVHPFLLGNSEPNSPLRIRSRSQGWFESLREKVDAAVHSTVDDLESLCDQRRQFDVQARLHVLLHGWIAVHLPLSLALVVLLVVHIVMGLKYW